MNLLERIRGAFQHPNGITRADDTGRKGLTHKIQRQYQYRVEADMSKYRTALATAENPTAPDRRLLYAVYRQVELDDHVCAQVRVAQATILQAAWELEGASPDLLKKTWFFDFLELAVETEVWGHSLIEFNPEMVAGEFVDILLMPRDHVRPEYGDIRLNTSDSTGVQYRTPEYPYVLEIGRPWELGLFRFVAIPAIRKRYADSDWSTYSEKFGMPFMVVRTASRQKNELDEKEAMAKNFGSNAWGIFDDQDSVEFIDAKSSANPHAIFSERIKLGEEQISKIINGQTGTSDEKAHVGSAQVHERMLDKFTHTRLTRIQCLVNDVLLPFLTSHGYPFGKAKFKFTDLDAPKILPDNAPPDQPEPKKKSLSISEIDTLYLSWSGDACGHEHAKTLSLAYKHPGKSHTKLKNAVWDGNADEAEAALFQGYYETLASAITDVTGQDWNALDVTSPDYELLRLMRRNAAEFAAAKTKAVMGGLVEAKGTAGKDKAAFMSEAKKLLRKHAGWLETEYQQAIAATEMGVKWRELTQDAGPADMLRYVTAGDDRVRPLHKILDGVTQPHDAAFWDTHCPPLGYRCRCTLIKLEGAAPSTPSREITEKEAPAAFRFNPGKTGRMFGKKHPYFEQFTASVLTAIVADFLKKVGIEI